MHARSRSHAIFMRIVLVGRGWFCLAHAQGSATVEEGGFAGTQWHNSLHSLTRSLKDHYVSSNPRFQLSVPNQCVMLQVCVAITTTLQNSASHLALQVPPVYSHFSSFTPTLPPFPSTSPLPLHVQCRSRRPPTGGRQATGARPPAYRMPTGAGIVRYTLSP